MSKTKEKCEVKAYGLPNVMNKCYRLGIDIGSTTVKIAVLDSQNRILFCDYERHFAKEKGKTLGIGAPQGPLFALLFCFL